VKTPLLVIARSTATKQSPPPREIASLWLAMTAHGFVEGREWNQSFSEQFRAPGGDRGDAHEPVEQLRCASSRGDTQLERFRWRTDPSVAFLLGGNAPVRCRVRADLTVGTVIRGHS
jgi:hypothetical protein